MLCRLIIVMGLYLTFVLRVEDETVSLWESDEQFLSDKEQKLAIHILVVFSTLFHLSYSKLLKLPSKTKTEFLNYVLWKLNR